MAIITSDTSQGGRDHQEDFSLVIMKGYANLLAVMDGHGGSEVSSFCFENLEKILDKVVAINKSFSETIVKDLIMELAEATKKYRSGSTISIVLIPVHGSVAHVGVLGDSPVVIKDRRGNINISPEHNVRSNIKERESAIARGGVYDDSGYIGSPHKNVGLQLSRALGDCRLEGIVIQEADVYSVELGSSSFVLVGSDGLFDPRHESTHKQIAALVKKIHLGASATDLVQDALDRKTRDNVTALLWKAY